MRGPGLATLVAHQRSSVAQRRRMIARARPSTPARQRLETALQLELAILSRLQAAQAQAQHAEAASSWTPRRPQPATGSEVH